MVGTRVLGLVAVAGMLAVACSGGENGEDTDAALAGAGATITTAAETQRMPSLPTSSDPCTTPAGHRLGPVPIEYGFEFDGERRPLGVRVLEESQNIWVVLHGAGLSWRDQTLFTDDLIDAVDSSSATIVFAQASASSLFWSQTPSFNSRYVEELLVTLSGSLCLDGTVVLAGMGQGALAAAQAVCETDLPIDGLFLQYGMVKITDCSVRTPVPLISIDLMDFVPGVEVSWNWPWDPPNTFERELTGGVGETPDDARVWAGLHGCEGEPERSTRDVVVLGEDDEIVQLAYGACEAPVVAFGVPTIAIDQDVYRPVIDDLRGAFDIVLRP